MSKLVRGASGDGWVQGTAGNVVLLVFRAVLTEDAIARAMELIDSLTRAHPSGVAVIADFEETTRLPPSNIMRTLSSQLARRGARILVGATVLEGASVSSMAKRTSVAMLTTVLKPPYPHRVVGTASAACDYVASKAVDEGGAAVAPGALLEVLMALKAPNPTSG